MPFTAVCPNIKWGNCGIKHEFLLLTIFTKLMIISAISFMRDVTLCHNLLNCGTLTRTLIFPQRQKERNTEPKKKPNPDGAQPH